MCFQRPQDQLFAQSVAEDIAFGPNNKGFSPDDVEALVAYAAERVGLDQRLSYLTAAGSKGLEFDSVVVVEPGAILDQGSGDLFVALTRATHELLLQKKILETQLSHLAESSL